MAREAKGWGRPKLSKESGIPYPTLAGLENGDQQSSTWIPAIAAATGVSALWLATGKGQMKLGETREIASQSARPDPAIILQTLDFLEEAFGSLNKTFDLREDADLFADAYEWMVEDDRPIDERNLVKFAEWRAKQQAAKTGDGNENQDRGTIRKAS